MRPQRVTIQFETGDPLACRGVAGGVSRAKRDAAKARPLARADDRIGPVDRGIGIAAGLLAVIATAVSAPVRGAVPEEGRGIRTPDWARLEAVLGTYDAPFAAEPPWGRLTAMAFIDDRTVAVIAEDGRLRVWDRIAHVTRARVDACRFQFVPSTGTQLGRNDRADVLAVSPDRLAAVGFVSGRVCIVDLATGRKAAEVEAGPMSGEGVVLMRIRFGSGRLVTYAGQTRTVSGGSCGPYRRRAATCAGGIRGRGTSSRRCTLAS